MLRQPQNSRRELFLFSRVWAGVRGGFRGLAMNENEVDLAEAGF